MPAMPAVSKPRLRADWFRKDCCPKGYAHPGLLKALVALEKCGDDPQSLPDALETVVEEAEGAAEDILGHDGDSDDLRERSRALYALADLAQKQARAAGKDTVARVKEAKAMKDELEKLGASIKDALKEGARERALELVDRFQGLQPEFQEILNALPEDVAKVFTAFAKNAAATADAFSKLRGRLAGA